jgi:small multidrug resistance family-3 protein
VTTNLATFTLAAFFEIAGCFAFWMWLRRGVTPLIPLLGIASLIGFAVPLTRVEQVQRRQRIRSSISTTV